MIKIIVPVLPNPVLGTTSGKNSRAQKGKSVSVNLMMMMTVWLF